MKYTLILITALVAVPCIASKPESTKEPGFAALRVEPLPFPMEEETATALHIEEIEAKVKVFDEKIGSYPPRLKDKGDRQAVYRDWSRTLLSAEVLKKREGDSERIACAVAALYRQGHNMDVKECGEHAVATIEAALRAYPDSIPLNWQASYFYLQIAPKFAPEGEKALLKLRKLLGTDQNLEVERGFVFAYLNQERIPEAQKQVDRCLQIRPKDEMLLLLKEALKSGKLERRSAK
jgi:tetratricopeptide (TPR) repeat protein